MASYGAVVTQGGTPVRYSDDYQRALDTRYIAVGVAMTYDVNLRLNGTAGLFKIFDHNLGYIPAMDAPRQTDRTNPSPQSSPIGSIMFCADSTSVYYITGGAAHNVKGTFYLYNFPINRQFDSTYKGNALARSAKSQYGIKITGNNTYGRSTIRSQDTLGFAVNTNVKNLSLAKIDQITAPVDPNTQQCNFTVTYDVAYPPLIKLSQKIQTGDIQTGPNQYVQVPNETWSAMSLSDVNAYMNTKSANQATLYISGAANKKSLTFSYVVYRDPSEIAG